MRMFHWYRTCVGISGKLILAAHCVDPTQMHRTTFSNTCICVFFWQLKVYWANPSDLHQNLPWSGGSAVEASAAKYLKYEFKYSGVDSHLCFKIFTTRLPTLRDRYLPRA